MKTMKTMARESDKAEILRRLKTIRAALLDVLREGDSAIAAAQ